MVPEGGLYSFRPMDLHHNGIRHFLGEVKFYVPMGFTYHLHYPHVINILQTKFPFLYNENVLFSDCRHVILKLLMEILTMKVKYQ